MQIDLGARPGRGSGLEHLSHITPNLPADAPDRSGAMQWWRVLGSGFARTGLSVIAPKRTNLNIDLAQVPEVAGQASWRM
jgi:hypothetical protein